MGKSSAPSAPDPQAAAQAQIGVNQATLNQLAQINNSNQQGPLGSLTWTRDPNTGQWTQTTQYSPAIMQQLQQQITNSDLGLGAVGNALQQVLNAGYAGSPVDLSHLPAGVTGAALYNAPLATSIDRGSLPGIQTGVTGAADPGSLAQAQQAVYGQMASRLDPQWQQAQEQFTSQLADQGIPQNSEAWNRAMSEFQREKTDAYQSANNAAVSAGNNLQQQMFGQALGAGQFANTAQNQAFQQLLSAAGFTNSAIGQQFGQGLQQGQFANAARQQALGEYLTQRGLPLSEIQALRGDGSVMAPNFAQQQQISGPNGAPNMAQLYGQNYQGQLNAYNSQVGQQNSMLSTLGNILTAFLL